MLQFHIKQEQRQAILEDLIAFVHRVALDKNASPAEFAALSEIAKVLCSMFPGYMN